MSAQFVAAIGENPEDDNLATSFANNLYSAFAGGSEVMRDRVGRIESSLLSDDRRYVFARAASPIYLTNLGVAVNQSGFAPDSAVAILDALAQVDASWTAQRLFTYLLKSLSELPEQQNSTWKRKLTNSRTRLSVGPDDLEMVVTAWLSGSRYAQIFTDLPAVQRSSRRPSADVWLRGSSGTDNWSEEFDKFLDFVTSVLERFLPWLLHACALLSSHAGGPAANLDWESLRSLVEARVAASDVGDSGQAAG